MTPTAQSQSNATREPTRRRRKLDDATRMAKALSHPIRTKILTRLNEDVASPNMLAQELGESLGVVSYHVRALLDLDCIELVDTQPRRGAIEHYYRATQGAMADKVVWDQLPKTARHSFAADWYKSAGEDLGKALAAGGFDERTDCHVSLTPLNLDERSWKKLSARVQKLIEYAQELQAETAGRTKKGQTDGEVRARLVVAQYEGAPAPARKKKR
jgi:DNA-binding transcriptional ArsR family regulator